MGTAGLVLTGKHIRLEPLDLHHVEGLIAASAGDEALYQWSPVPRGEAEVAQYVETAMAWRDAETAVPYATVRVDDGTVIGSTRFWNLERGRGRRATLDTAAVNPTLVKSVTHG